MKKASEKMAKATIFLPERNKLRAEAYSTITGDSFPKVVNTAIQKLYDSLPTHDKTLVDKIVERRLSQKPSGT